MTYIGSITDQTGISALTPGERECLRLVGKLQSSKQIARILEISPHTVDQRMRVACRKIGAVNRLEAALMLGEFEALNGPERIEPFPQPIAQPGTDGPASHQLATDKGLHEPHMIQRAYFAPAFEDATVQTWISRFGLPFPSSGRTRNDLTVLQTIAWLLAISGSAILLFLLILASLVGLSLLT